MAKQLKKDINTRTQSPSIMRRILRLSDGEETVKSSRRSLDLKVHISQNIKFIPSPPPLPEGSTDTSFEENNFPDADVTDGQSKPSLETSPSLEKEEEHKIKHFDSLKKGEYQRFLSRNKEKRQRKVSKVAEGGETNVESVLLT
eukprot:GFUD01096953.1.p1 GENE.GFUD01096953.1~~GFUD01096953.1.p1  ORF type:complete len:144 (+),score=48.17 GFUD01096953.1:49-480(+)